VANELQICPAQDAMPSQADTDAQVVALWIHGRSRHTQRAYRTNAERFLVFASKPLAQVSLGDIQAFADSLTFLAQ
jgi:integrase/recombinase XerD